MLDTHYEDASVIVAVVRNVGFVGWRASPHVEGIQQWHRLGRTLAARYPAAAACFDVVIRGTPLISEGVRRAAAEMAGDPDSFPLGWAHVLLIPGLAGSAVRAFIGTILLVSRAPAPAKIFGGIEPAAAWLAPKLTAHGWTARELQRGCAELVERLNEY